MKKFRTYVTIIAHKDIGIIEAEDENELNLKVRKENLAFKGLPDNHLKMDIQIKEVRGYKVNKEQKRNDMPDFSTCETEEQREALNDMIDNLW